MISAKNYPFSYALYPQFPNFAAGYLIDAKKMIRFIGGMKRRNDENKDETRYENKNFEELSERKIIKEFMRYEHV